MEESETLPPSKAIRAESKMPKQAKSPKDRWFDPWLCAKGEALKALVGSFQASLEAHEKFTKARKRARRGNDAETHKAVVEAIVVNLALACLDPPAKGARLAVPLRKGRGRNRYENPELSTRIIRDVIEKLSETEALSLQLGISGKITTTVFPTQWFDNRVQDHGVMIDDFGRREDEEVIILKRKDKAEDAGWTFDAGASYADYTDTDTTRALRAEVRSFNRFLEAADLTFIEDDVDPPVLTNDRRLRRYFTAFKDGGQTFDRSGRLFGGWWLQLKKERRANIRIQGEPISILDYASMFGRLAYAHQGLQAPEHDLYDLTGLLRGYDTTIKNHRKGVKKVFNAMMFGGAMGKRLPQGAKAELPKKVTVMEVREAIKARNPELASLFGTQVGYRLMFEESRILLKVLAMLMEKDIVALPLHDGLMVAESHGEEARQAMIEAAEEITGFSFPVDLKA